MADERKMVTITDFLRPAEIERAMKLYNTCKPGTFAERCDAEIIAPVLDRINKTLGQENLSRFLAYAVEYVFNESARRG